MANSCLRLGRRFSGRRNQTRSRSSGVACKSHERLPWVSIGIVSLGYRSTNVLSRRGSICAGSVYLFASVDSPLQCRHYRWSSYTPDLCHSNLVIALEGSSGLDRDTEVRTCSRFASAREVFHASHICSRDCLDTGSQIRWDRV